MVRITLLILSIICAVFLLGCGKMETANNSNKTATNSTTSTAPSGEKIGVPECDDFLAKYDACVSAHVPDSAKAQYSSMLKQWRDSWRQQAAANPQAKGALAAACKQAAEQARTSMKAYNCNF